VVLQRSSQGAALQPHGNGPDSIAAFDVLPAVDAYMVEQEADPGPVPNSGLGVPVTLVERIDRALQAGRRGAAVVHVCMGPCGRIEVELVGDGQIVLWSALPARLASLASLGCSDFDAHTDLKWEMCWWPCIGPGAHIVLELRTGGDPHTAARTAVGTLVVQDE